MVSRNILPPGRTASIVAGPGAAGEAIAFANAFAGSVGISADATARLAIIVEELVLNLVEHGGGGIGSQLIGLELRHSEGTVTLVLTDLGEPFDPREAPALGDLPPDRGGGAGLAMIRAWATIDDYRRDGDHNRLALTLRD